MRIAKQFARILWLAVIIIALGACGDIKENFVEMMRVHKLLTEKYGLTDSQVEMNIENNQIFTVRILNSPMNTLSAAQKETKAREIASFVKQHFHIGHKLNTINVAFGMRRTHLLFLTTTVDTNYSFNADLLEAPSQDTGSSNG